MLSSRTFSLSVSDFNRIIWLSNVAGSHLIFILTVLFLQPESYEDDMISQQISVDTTSIFIHPQMSFSLLKFAKVKY